jgi:hypothetical protein
MGIQTSNLQTKGSESCFPKLPEVAGMTAAPSVTLPALWSDAKSDLGSLAGCNANFSDISGFAQTTALNLDNSVRAPPDYNSVVALINQAKKLIYALECECINQVCGNCG